MQRRSDVARMPGQTCAKCLRSQRSSMRVKSCLAGSDMSACKDENLIASMEAVRFQSTKKTVQRTSQGRGYVSLQPEAVICECQGLPRISWVLRLSWIQMLQFCFSFVKGNNMGDSRNAQH